MSFGFGKSVSGIDSLYSLNIESDLAVGGNATVAGNVTVSGNINLAGVTVSTLHVTGTSLLSGNVTASANVSAVGNVSGGNITTAGQVVATGNVSGGNISTVGLLTGGSATITANLSAGNISTAGVLAVTGNASAGNISTAGVLAVTGNASAGNISTVGLLTGGSATITANLSAGNISTAGVLAVTGNASAGNISTVGLLTSGSATVTANLSAGNISTAGVLAVTGNASAGNISTAGVLAVTGNASAGNISTAGVLAVTGNASAGNISTTGISSGNQFLAGNGASGACSVSFTNSAGTLGFYRSAGNTMIAQANSTDLLKIDYLTGVSILNSGLTVGSGFIYSADGGTTFTGHGFNSEPSTGIYRPTTNTLGISSGGTHTASFSNTSISFLKNFSGTQEFAYYTRTSDLPTNSGTVYNMVFDNAAVSVGSISYAGSTFTLPIAGLYFVAFSVVWASNAVGTRNVQIWVNGATTTQLNDNRTGDVGDVTRQTLTGVLQLAANSTLQPSQYQNSTSTLTCSHTDMQVLSFTILKLS